MLAALIKSLFVETRGGGENGINLSTQDFCHFTGEESFA